MGVAEISHIRWKTPPSWMDSVGAFNRFFLVVLHLFTRHNFTLCAIFKYKSDLLSYFCVSLVSLFFFESLLSPHSLPANRLRRVSKLRLSRFHSVQTLLRQHSRCWSLTWSTSFAAVNSLEENKNKTEVWSSYCTSKVTWIILSHWRKQTNLFLRIYCKISANYCRSSWSHLSVAMPNYTLKQ